MTIELSVNNRLHLDFILSPIKEGSYEDLKAKKSLLKKVVLKTNELEEIEFKTEDVKNLEGVLIGQNYVWKNDPIIEVNLSSLEISFLKSILPKVSKSKQLNESLFELYDLIIGDIVETEEIK